MKRLTAENLRKIPINKPKNKIEYIHDLILVAFHKRKISQPLLCMNELIEVINNINIPLKTHQMSQVYLYSTYQRYQNLAETKKKIMAILDQEKKKVDPKSVAEWIHQKIQAKEILFSNKAKRVMSVQRNINKTPAESKISKLPSLIGSSTQKLQDQLKYLIEIFEQMESQRQNSGLIPISEDNDENEVELPSFNIPFDPELHDLNNNLNKLRIKAEDRLSRIIELARQDPKIRRKLEEAIERFQKARIEANEKVGRVGAMKALKRLQDKKEKQAKKIRQMQLGEGQNLVRAAQLYALLTLPEIKRNKLIY